MRWLVTSSLVFLISCASDYDFPSPPAEATASCVVDMSPAIEKTGTLWFNAKGELIRLDAVEHDANGASAAVYHFAYDEAGRLVEARGPNTEFQYRYSPEQIEMLEPGNTWLMQLEEGRVVHYGGPTERAAEDQWFADYSYDLAGRMTSYSGRGFWRDQAGIRHAYMWLNEYGYDEYGRLVSVRKWSDDRPEETRSISYDESDRQLTITIEGMRWETQRWVYNFDASDRVIRAAVRRGDDAWEESFATYTYGDGTIEEVAELPARTLRVRAAGRCEPPSTVISPLYPLPIRPPVLLPSLYDVTAIWHYEVR